MAKDQKGKELPPGIRQRKNGRYEGRVKYDYRSYSIYGDTVTEVKKKMTDLHYKLEHGQFVDKTVITLNEWFHTWISVYKEKSVKRGTIIAYKNGFRYYIEPTLGDKKLSKIRGEHIQQMFNDLAERGIAVSYIKVLAAILNGCFKQAFKNGLIESNPVAKTTLPKQTEKGQRRVLTQEEQEIFFQYARESYLYNLFALMLMTGMRTGEARGLRYCDIDRKNKVIHITRTLKYEAGLGFFEDTPKTLASKRDIPLTEEIEAILQDQRKRFETNIIDPKAYTFRTPEGGPISRERVQAEIDRIVKAVQKDKPDFKRFTSHCFRHTFATRAIENGMKPQTLKTILGHSSLAMTMDLYSHVLPSTKADEMEKISSAFNMI